MRKQKQPPLPSVSEKTEELWADKAARMMGWTVIRFSQPRKTMQTRGIPDRLYLHVGRSLAVWAEIKSEKGKVSESQKALHDLLSHCGQHVVCGTANTVGEFLADCLTAERLTEKR